MSEERVHPWRGQIDVCFVGLTGYIDAQTDRMLDALKRAGVVVEGAGFEMMDATDVEPDSPLAQALSKEGWTAPPDIPEED